MDWMLDMRVQREPGINIIHFAYTLQRDFLHMILANPL